MRDEWLQASIDPAYASSPHSSQGLTKPSNKKSMQNISLRLSQRSLRLKEFGNVREISERRQVGDAEEMMHPSGRGGGSGTPWWKNVTMEEGM